MERTISASVQRGGKSRHRLECKISFFPKSISSTTTSITNNLRYLRRIPAFLTKFAFLARPAFFAKAPLHDNKFTRTFTPRLHHHPPFSIQHLQPKRWWIMVCVPVSRQFQKAIRWHRDTHFRQLRQRHFCLARWVPRYGKLSYRDLIGSSITSITRGASLC